LLSCRNLFWQNYKVGGSWCNTNSANCGNCGGDWCSAEPEYSFSYGPFCVKTACGCDADGKDWCDVDSYLQGDDWCNANEANCNNCAGDWCYERLSVPAPVKSPVSPPVSPPTTPSVPVMSYSYGYTWGTCCFQHGSDEDACGTCTQAASPEQWCGQSAENCIKSCPRATACYKPTPKPTSNPTSKPTSVSSTTSVPSPSPTQLKSCAGRCTLYSDSFPCQCDQGCPGFNDCCPDFYSLCFL